MYININIHIFSWYNPCVETQGSYFTIKEPWRCFSWLIPKQRVYFGLFRCVVMPLHLHPLSQPANKSARTNEKCYRCTSICLQSVYLLAFFVLHPKKYLLKSISFCTWMYGFYFHTPSQNDQSLGNNSMMERWHL